MEYNITDLNNIAKLFIGKGTLDLPKIITINEDVLYECCYDLNIDASILDQNEFDLSIFSRFLCQLAETGNFIEFINYYFNTYIENKVSDLTEAGYNIFQLKDKLLVSLNTLWSISNQEFGLYNSKFVLKDVDFKEYDKMGEGGFSTVYRCPTDNLQVNKVLNSREKADAGSIHRFKREYEIMREHNNSGYTINVFDYDPQKLVYSMEKAKISLEDYVIETNLGEDEKDQLVLRCAECMKYLHNYKHGIIHRDFHPGNILLNNTGKWVVTDFGLAKDFSAQYSHQTTTTHAVGRAWFTDPMQLFALKDGNFITDMFSLARTIDFVMNGNMTGSSHKYSAVVYKATAADPENRYKNIDEMMEDIEIIYTRTNYESPEEKASQIVEQFQKSGELNVVQIISMLDNDDEAILMWKLIFRFRQDLCNIFISIINVSFIVALREVRRVSSIMQSQYHDFSDYDVVANWAIGVIQDRKDKNDEVNFELIKIIEYVSSNVRRFGIMRKANLLKNDTMIDGHLRAILTYHEGA